MRHHDFSRFVRKENTPVFKFARMLTTAMAAALIVPLAGAQDTKKDAPPKPSASRSQALLDGWNDIGRKLTAIAEDFPEDKYDFKPNPAERSFAEQLLHVSVNLYFFIEAAKGAKPPSGMPRRADFATKAAVVDYVKKSFADGAALIKSKGDRGMSDLFVNPFDNQQTRFSDGAWGFIEHSGEHYGQLVVYYRVLGMVPPESRPKK
jgi:uncharacterized damage-inducible protein DinB